MTTIKNKPLNRGLVTDPSAVVSDDQQGMTVADNVSIRAAGMIETRPCFEEFYSSSAIHRSLRALRAFRDGVVSIDYFSDGAGWVSWALSTDTQYPPFLTDALAPQDFYHYEPKFAESRLNLYSPLSKGTVVWEDPDGEVMRLAGVEMTLITDYRGADMEYEDMFVGYDPGDPTFASVVAITDRIHTVGYRFVFKRKDSNGYIRRSRPSYPIITCVRPDTNEWGSGSYFYLPDTSYLQEGDQIECYRTLAVQSKSLRTNNPLSAPIPDYYLAWEYTITADDVLAGFITPPPDTTPEDQLGAELYTDAAQESELAEKYPPPLANSIAWFQRVMWYGNTTGKHRSPNIKLQHLYRNGPIVDAWYGGTNGTLDPDVIQIGQGATTDPTLVLKPGMYITDNLVDGYQANGTMIPAYTQVLKVYDSGIPGIWFVQLSQNWLSIASNVLVVSQTTVPNGAVQGLIAETTASVSCTGGASSITVPSDVAFHLLPGMYVTDRGFGPAQDGTYFRADTLITSVVGTTVNLNKTLKASGTAATVYYGDTFSLSYGAGPTKVNFYAWTNFATGAKDNTDYTALPPGTDYDRCFIIHDTTFRQWGYQSAISTLVQWINYYAPTTGFQAVPDGWITPHDYVRGPYTFHESPPTYIGEVLSGTAYGDTNLFNGLGSDPFPGVARGFTLEEVAYGGLPATISSSNPRAWNPFTTAPEAQTTDNDARENRLYWSQVDEPEAVSLPSFVDIGSQGEPILNLVALRNALLVFKTDGLWRITGSGPYSWSVDLVDPTCRLVNAQSVAVMRNVAYAWTMNGFYAVTESEIASLSQGRIDNQLRIAASAVRNNFERHATHVIPLPYRNTVLLCQPVTDAGPDNGLPGNVLAWNQATQTWTTWDLPMYYPVGSDDFDTMYYGRRPTTDDPTLGTNGCPYQIRKMTLSPTGTDVSYAITGVDYVGSTVTVPLSGIGLWRPRAGDFVACVRPEISTNYARILDASYSEAGSEWTLTLDGSNTNAATQFQAYEAVDISLVWPANAVPGIPQGSFVREIMWISDETQRTAATGTLLPSWDVGAASELSATAYLLHASPLPVRATTQTYRAGISRQVGRNATLAVHLKTSDMYCQRILDVSQVFYDSGATVRR